MGKPTLVRQMESTAGERQALIAYIDESVNSVLEVPGCWST
ncbi:hypothetical protein [Streptomyces sp. NPDC005322]